MFVSFKLQNQRSKLYVTVSTKCRKLVVGRILRATVLGQFKNRNKIAFVPERRSLSATNEEETATKEGDYDVGSV
jgi:hypothetical protein